MSSLEALTKTYTWLKGNTANNLQSKDELGKALRLAGHNPSRKALDKYWSATSGTVSFNTFLQLVEGEKPFRVESLLRAFARLGGTPSGHLDYNILKKALTSKGDPLNEEDLGIIFGEQATSAGEVDYLRLTSAVLATLSIVAGKQNVHSDQTDSTHQNSNVNSRTFTRRRGSNHAENFSQSRNDFFLIPNEYRSWKSVCRRGHIFMDDAGSFSSHQYVLTLDGESDVWLSIRPVSGNVDLEVLLFSEQEGSGRNLAASTQRKDSVGNYVLEAHLSAGQYLLVPFSSGCRLRSKTSPTSSPSWTPLRLNSGHPSPKLLEILREVFRASDLDMNNTLSYEEFNLFSAWTNGEMASDDEWDILKSNFQSSSSGELTEDGFVQLHLAQLAEQDGEDELWTMLRKMGYNSSLLKEQACSFAICVQSESSRASLRAIPVTPGSAIVERTLCRILTEQGALTRVKNMNDLTMHHLALPHRTTYAIRNKSHSPVLMLLDCSGSRNCLSHRGKLDFTTEVPPKTCMIAHHLIGDDELMPWTACCEETFIK